MNVFPVVFRPILKPKIWGGRRLAELFDKLLPPDEVIGESWECADLPGVQSVVARGPAAGKTLHELVEQWGSGLLGRVRAVDGRFPLLLKFIDAAEPLSIQVHPGDAAGAQTAKHEAWYIIHAEPGAVIYRGLRLGVETRALAEAVIDAPDEIPGLLNRIPVRAGQGYYLPGGIVHALGAGVVVAEVQTPVNVTYRLYDWGRTRSGVDAGLHVEEALNVIDSSLRPEDAERRSHVGGVFTTVTRFVRCASFMIEKVRFVAGMEQDIPYAELVCWMILEGRGEVGWAGGRESFSGGDVMILPADMKEPRLKTETDCTWLEVTIPVASDLADYARLDRTASITESDGGPVPLNLRIVKNAD